MGFRELARTEVLLKEENGQIKSLFFVQVHRLPSQYNHLRKSLSGNELFKWQLENLNAIGKCAQNNNAYPKNIVDVSILEIVDLDIHRSSDTAREVN